MLTDTHKSILIFMYHNNFLFWVFLSENVLIIIFFFFYECIVLCYNFPHPHHFHLVLNSKGYTGSCDHGFQLKKHHKNYQLISRILKTSRF